MWPTHDPPRGGLDGPTGRLIHDAADGCGRPIGRPRSPRSNRGDAVDRRIPSGCVFFIYKADGEAVCLILSFSLALAGEVRSSIWLVLKTIHWLLTLGKREVHFLGGEGKFL
jgi:hypothetical protein